MLIVPYSETFTTEYDVVNGDWIKNYALNSFEYAIVIIPLIILLITLPRVKNRITKKNTNCNFMFTFWGSISNCISIFKHANSRFCTTMGDVGFNNSFSNCGNRFVN